MRREAQDRLDKRKSKEVLNPNDEEKPKRPASMVMGIFYMFAATFSFVIFAAFGQTIAGVVVSMVLFYYGTKQIIDSMNK